jgi:acetolactate synthase I/III small subunit
MRSTFVVHVEDRPGVLNRVASLVARRGFNIESITAGRTDVAGMSRMTLVVDADESAIPRIQAHLYKLVHVRRVEDVTRVASVCRDLAMVKVASDAASRSEIMQLVDVFRARVVDVTADSLIIEITGTEDKVDGLVDMLRPYGVLEMARTGRVSMARGATVSMAPRPAVDGVRPERRNGVGRRLEHEADDETLSCSV